MDIEIVPAYTHTQEINALFSEYTDMLIANDRSFQEYLAIQHYDEEVNHLEEKYGMPSGRLYLAYCDGEAAGCIGLKKIDERNCEMKRLYVRPQYREQKIGKLLVEKIILDAKEIGYSSMLLDTLPFLDQAIHMYEKFGFYTIDCYNNSPMSTSIYMRLDLKRERIIKPMEEKYLLPSLDLVEEVFAECDSPEEGKMVRRLVEEIRARKYYLPELELLMCNEKDEIIGYAMFSRFHIEGRYENELLLLTPVAVKTKMQRQHISKELLEYGFEKAKEAGFKAILVEGNPQNYNPRGFQSSYLFGIGAGPNIKLPRPECLMVKELEDGALDRMQGQVDYSFYDVLCPPTGGQI